MPTYEEKKLSLLNEEETANLYKNLFSTDTGKLVLEDLKNHCFVKTSTADENPYVTYWHEGMRNVVLHIETKINFQPEVRKDATEA